MIDRRTSLKLMGATAAVSASPRLFAQAAAPGVRWVTTTPDARWQPGGRLEVTAPAANFLTHHVAIAIDQPAQPIEGFGGAFSERGWDALQSLPAAAREEALDALFGPTGADFTICRTPIAANDFARGWYSYDETPGDFALDRFSIANDRATLIPFIHAAQKRRTDLRLWASPWSPPTWMKRNGHYAMAPAWPGQPSNGIRPDQLGREGEDGFIQEDRHFDAYARYFRRYVEAYGDQGIRIGAVMPQNEYNSAQPFPSCCWTPEGLARFLPFLGREMGRTGTDILLGTLERGNADLVSRVLADPAAGPLIKGIGVQWAGKGALSEIQRRHPDLPIWGSEQECGTGANDWHYSRYGWDLMKRYFTAGARVWQYWNMALPLDGLSGWGWPQNALISVDTVRGRYSLTNDYWLMRHFSAFVKPGARRIPTSSFLGFENQLAFRNPNGDLIVIIQNDLSTPLSVGLIAGGREIRPTLPADSFSTILIPAAQLVVKGRA